MRNAIVTDLNRCVGCLSCSVACKAANSVPVGNFWNKVLRIGPNPKAEGGQCPDVEMYFLPMGCQHCENPECVAVCPTEASHVLEDGTVQNYAEPVNERYLREMAYFLDYAQSGAGPSVNTPETARDVLKLTLGEL